MFLKFAPDERKHLISFRTSELLADWDRGKPVAGHLKPEDAMRSLAIFEGKFQRLQDDRTNLIKAKEALELADSGVVSPSEERVQVSYKNN